MAKIKHSNTYDTLDIAFTSAKERGILHLNSTEHEFNGDFLQINEHDLINFGTCGYLGIEKHPLVLSKSYELLHKYGSQFSISRSYIKSPYQLHLESLIGQIFDNHPIILYTSTSITHQSVIGTLIQPSDLIILDQQVHYSVQYPCLHTKLQGTIVKMIRHNDMNMLEDFIKRDYNKYNRIWYMSDGVYSMYGDLPNKAILKILMDKYPKLYLYFDDAHGVGWTGKYGSGTTFEDFKHNNKVIVISTLAKGFGCVGGIAIFNDYEMFRRTDIYGGILSYTHPLSPSNIGAATGAAELFLSDELPKLQDELKNLMIYLNQELERKNLPNISSNETPIYFIGTGSSKVTYNLINKVMNDGIYVNPAIFPVVPNDKCGLRFTLTRHNTIQHIDTLIQSLSKNFEIAIEEEGENINDVNKIFGIIPITNINQKEAFSSDLKINKYTTIADVDEQLWDNAFKDNGSFSHRSLLSIEEIFSNNNKKEHNWDFYYIIITDHDNNLILATFFTSGIYKDDLLSLENTSKQIEREREINPYFLCSVTLAMGCLFTEGEHLFIQKDHEFASKALSSFFLMIKDIKTETQSSVLILRDFPEDHHLSNIFEKEGFIKIQMPNSNIITNKQWNTYEELMNMIKSSKKRRNINREAIKLEPIFEISYKNNLTESECKMYYSLSKNVEDRNFAINFFSYPEKITSVLSKDPNWEFIELKIKGNPKIVACVWSFVGNKHYSPMIIGLDYDYLKSHFIYKQVILQIIKRANKLNKNKIYLGFSADYEKEKYLADSIPTNSFIKVDDTFNFELIETFSNMNELTVS